MNMKLFATAIAHLPESVVINALLEAAHAYKDNPNERTKYNLGEAVIMAFFKIGMQDCMTLEEFFETLDKADLFDKMYNNKGKN